MSTEEHSWVTGHHIYKNVWTPVIGEVLQCRREHHNLRDPYAVGVFKSDRLVGRVPRELSHRFFTFIRSGGSIEAVISGKRENRRRRGLEVPAVYKLSQNGNYNTCPYWTITQPYYIMLYICITFIIVLSKFSNLNFVSLFIIPEVPLVGGGVPAVMYKVPDPSRC